MKYLFTTCCLLMFSFACNANDNDSSDIGNNILFFKDPRVDILQKIYSRKAAVDKKKTVRVQIFQATSRDLVFEARAKFSARFPGIPTVITYAPPNFKLRAGDFDTNQEAFKFMKTLKSDFPASFVIEEKVFEKSTKNGK